MKSVNNLFLISIRIKTNISSFFRGFKFHYKMLKLNYFLLSDSRRRFLIDHNFRFSNRDVIKRSVNNLARQILFHFFWITPICILKLSWIYVTVQFPCDVDSMSLLYATLSVQGKLNLRLQKPSCRHRRMIS